jgi:hypothetical protein
MTEAEKSLATRRDKILADQMRIAASRKSDLCTAFIETARRIAAEYPDLSPAEKQAQYDALKHEIETMYVRVHQNCSRVLGELSMILGSSNS